MRFIKMHGIGNDYVYVNGFEQTIDDPSALAIRVADRHFGIGGDGLILAMPPEPGPNGAGAHVRMRMFNADGSESEMCGNGIRCVCKLAHDHNVTPGITAANPMRIQTGNGILTLSYTLDAQGKVDQVTVNMGRPILNLPDIPVDESHIDEALAGASYVSMGNPHVVIYHDDVASLDLEKIGPAIENHPAFPRRINAHWVQVVSPDEVIMRTWERGSGITLACGTGACAVCVAGVLQQKTNRKLLAHLPGGDLQLEWREADNNSDPQAGEVYMTGPATETFTGEWPEA